MHDPIRTDTTRSTTLSPVDQEKPRWSLRLVRVLGVDIYLHVTLIALLALALTKALVDGQGGSAIVRGALVVLVIFTTIVLHELGHAVMAARFGARARHILLMPIGGITRLDKMPEKPTQELLVAIAGPTVNLTIAVLLFGFGRLLDGPVGLERIRQLSEPYLTDLIWLNIALATFNLLPAYPMDGGRILRALLAHRLDRERATQIAARIGQGLAVVLAIGGLVVSPFLVVIALFVWLGAEAESARATTNVALTGVSVRQGMVTSFKTVAATDPLSHAVKLTIENFQRDFPVTEGTDLVGVLTQSDILQGIAKRGGTLRVGDAMHTELATTCPIAPLSGALTHLAESKSPVLLVVEGGQLVGLLSAALDVGSLLAALQSTRLTVTEVAVANREATR